MIVVTGTKRSGTSMWMQALQAAGLPVLGDRYPTRFKKLKAANPAGFWESRLRAGVNWTTNPDPETGVYLHPEDTRLHALKVFIPGLVRTEHTFLHRVIATVRPWREYVRSLERLHALEDEAIAATGGDKAEERLRDRALQRARRPPELEWWEELYSLIRDSSVRRYPTHLVTYDHLLEHAEHELREVLAWIGEGDLDAAVATIRPELRTQHQPEVQPTVVDAEAVRVFDAVYGAIHGERRLEPGLVRQMNALHERLRPLSASLRAASPA